MDTLAKYEQQIGATQSAIAELEEETMWMRAYLSGLRQMKEGALPQTYEEALTILTSTQSTNKPQYLLEQTSETEWAFLEDGGGGWRKIANWNGDPRWIKAFVEQYNNSDAGCITIVEKEGAEKEGAEKEAERKALIAAREAISANGGKNSPIMASIAVRLAQLEAAMP